MSRILFALLAANSAAAVQAQAQVKVEEPWVRGMVATQTVTGAFLRLTSPAKATLVGASSPIAGRVEIHHTTMDGGVMRMRRVDGVELPAGQTVALEPGGYHVMLMQVARPLKEGDTVPLTLIVEGADGKREPVTVQVPVKALTTPAHGRMK